VYCRPKKKRQHSSINTDRFRPSEKEMIAQVSLRLLSHLVAGFTQPPAPEPPTKVKPLGVRSTPRAWEPDFARRFAGSRQTSTIAFGGANGVQGA